LTGTSARSTGIWPPRLGPAAADDLAAETFLVAFGKRGTFDPSRGQVRPWLEERLIRCEVCGQLFAPVSVS
jgi:hypothetical protein